MNPRYPRSRHIYSNAWGPIPFRSAGRAPVRGGRWKIRRGFGERPWHAWTSGRAERFSRWFETHEQAIEYATAIAWMFKNPTPERLRSTLTKYTNYSPASIERMVQRYAREPLEVFPCGDNAAHDSHTWANYFQCNGTAALPERTETE